MVPIAPGAQYGKCVNTLDVISYAGGFCGSTEIATITSPPLYCTVENGLDLPETAVGLINTFSALSAHDFQYAVLMAFADPYFSTYLPQIAAECLPIIPDLADPTTVQFTLVINLLADLKIALEADFCVAFADNVISALLPGIGRDNLANCELQPLGENSYVFHIDVQNVTNVLPPEPETLVPQSLVPESPSGPTTPTSSHTPPSKKAPEPSSSSTPSKGPTKGPTEEPSTPVGEGGQLAIWPTLFLGISLIILVNLQFV